ncbi:MAG: hypothetical protein JXB62_16885 [Pirellulales bacterium]|nr:hypothetical protein [Pirellulales bacterium]
MVSTAVTPDCTVEQATGDLVFRIRGSSRHGQIVRLRSTKCTIGSGPRCTLRLRARGVGPIHCLVLRGRSGTVVRRWSPDTRLNGHTFADADLGPGDLLSVGTVELEVVESGRPAERTAATTESPGWEPVQRRPSPPSPDTLPSSRDADQEAESLRTAEQEEGFRAQRDALVAQREDLRQQQRQWQAERAELTRQIDERARELEDRWAELDTQREALQRDRQRWDLDRTKQEAPAAEASVPATAGQEEIEAFQAQRLEFEQQREQFERQLEQREQERQYWEAQRVEGEAQQAEWEAQRAETEGRLAEDAKRLEKLHEEMQAEREAFEQRRRQWEADRTRVESEQVDPAAASRQTAPQEPQKTPVELADVFRQMGSVQLLGEGETLEEPVPGTHRVEESVEETTDDDAAESETLSFSRSPQTSQASQPAEAPRRTPAAKPTAGEGEEESIDDYMSRLMERVNATASRREQQQGSQGLWSQPSDVAKPAANVDQGPTKEVQLAADQETDQETDQGEMPTARKAETSQTTKMTPRAVAAERSAGLSAMRELANVSAQTAIAHHARRQMILARRWKLLTALLSVLVGGALTTIWWTWDIGNIPGYGAGLCLLIALLWTAQAVGLARRLRVADSSQSGQEPAEPEGPPGARQD